jgi:hypothetical protein
LAAPALIEPLQDHEKSRDKEHRKAGRSDHSSEHANPKGLARVSACSGRKNERQNAKDEGKRRHEDWPEPYPRGINRRLKDWLAIENAVLARVVRQTSSSSSIKPSRPVPPRGA